MNHKELLRKYIEYIRATEGTDFLANFAAHDGNLHFTAMEWAELQSLTREGLPNIGEILNRGVQK